MKNNLLLSEMVHKYHKPLRDMMDELSLKCVGGEETTLNFPSGKVIIKLN